MGKKQTGGNVVGQIAEVIVVPCRLDLPVNARDIPITVPAYADAIRVDRGFGLERVHALINKRMFRLIDQLIQINGGTTVSLPTTHEFTLRKKCIFNQGIYNPHL